MNQVLASTATARIAAAALTAATIIGGAFSANAQQVASTQPDYSRCEALRGSSNARAYPDCIVGTLQAHTRQLQERTRSEAALSQCITFLSTKKSEGATFDRPITRDNACAVARQFGMRNG